MNMSTATSSKPVSPTAQQFQRLLQDFIDNFERGRYDTIHKLKLVDEIADKFPHLHREKKKMIEGLLERPATCRIPSLNEYQLYSNVYIEIKRDLYRDKIL